MTRDEAKTIKVGDLLVPDPYWNETGSRKLPSPTRVLGINRETRSQTGTLLNVTFTGRNGDAWIDAGWFLGWHGGH
jgi:hypothetical protein